MGDRSGGREPKGSSLKKSKKNPGDLCSKDRTYPYLIGRWLFDGVITCHTNTSVQCVTYISG